MNLRDATLPVSLLSFREFVKKTGEALPNPLARLVRGRGQAAAGGAGEGSVYETAPRVLSLKIAQEINHSGAARALRSCPSKSRHSRHSEPSRGISAQHTHDLVFR